MKPETKFGFLIGIGMFLMIVLFQSENPELRHWAVKEMTRRAWDEPRRIAQGVGDATLPG